MRLEDLMDSWLRWYEERHENHINDNRACFADDVPDDDGVYAYTYYEFGFPVYHGYTANARKRAKQHKASAPWATWVDEVRYRRCATPQRGHRLETRLQRKVPSLCHIDGMTRAYHGVDWSHIEEKFKMNHVTGHCRLPGGRCDPERIRVECEQFIREEVEQSESLRSAA